MLNLLLEISDRDLTFASEFDIVMITIRISYRQFQTTLKSQSLRVSESVEVLVPEHPSAFCPDKVKNSKESTPKGRGLDLLPKRGLPLRDIGY